MRRGVVGGVRCEQRLDVRGGVAPPRRKIPLDPPLSLLPRHARLGAMEDGFHVVPVRVEGVGGVVVGVVALADPGRAIVALAVGESGGVEPVDRLGIGGSEGEVRTSENSPE
jgi:hypothetical protein